MNVPFVSIAFIAIVVVFLIIGLVKGFFKSILSILKKALGFVGGYFAAKFLTKPLYDGEVGRSVANWFVDFFTKKGGIYVEEFSQEAIADKLNNSLLPAKLVNSITDLIAKLGLQEGTIAYSLGEAVTYIVILLALFVVAYIIVRILAGLLGKAFEKAAKDSKGLNAGDKLLGGLLYACLGVLAVDLVCLLIGVIVPGDGQLAAWLSNNMHLNDDTFSIAKFAYNNNVLVWLWNLIMKLILK